MSQNFIHLRICSSYSMLKGAIKVPEILKLAIQNNMPAVGISDYNNMFGVLEFSSTLSKAGIQPIIGMILSVSRQNSSFDLNSKKTSDILLIAQNDEGYRNLMHIISAAYLKYGKDGMADFPMDELGKYSDGVIALTGGLKGPIGTNLAHGLKDNAVRELKFLKEIFKDRLYFEIIRDSRENFIETDQLNLAYDFNVPLVATNNVFFADEDMVEAHDVLICIDQVKLLSDDDRERSLEDYYFKSQNEMLELFSDLKEATDNTILIAERCSTMAYERKPMLPKVDIAKDRTPDDELSIRAHEGLLKKFQIYGILDEKDQKPYYERLEYELSVIKKMGFSSYFLIVSDFITWAVNHSVPVGPGRGSGAGSIVAWCIRITNLDPLKFRLIFERFLNPERVSMPDFDVDFCQDKREQVIEYVCQKYGHDRVGHIIAFGKLQARVVLRDVGRVLGMSYGFIDKICKLVPQNPTNPLTLAQAIEVEPALKTMINEDEQVRHLIDLGLKLEGMTRHASTHAAGIVIANQPLDDLVPLYKDPKSDIPVTQFNMKFVEKAGLVKFDFLGLKTLTTIQQTVDLLKNRDINLNIDMIPLDDQKTYDMVNRIETVGVFQLESTGMRDVIRKLRPDHFEDFVALVALYRPGPMDDIPKYVARKHGEEPISYPHPMLKDILEPTYGVMVYQEQVMQIAQVIAGYTLGQADLLRRAMGKKIKAEMDMQKERFVQGCLQNHLTNQEAEALFEQISKFAGYGFNKSHATPYALIAYQTAYLKANYPVEFMTALMNLDKNNTDKISYFKQELDRINVKLLPPDINKSNSNFSVETLENGELAIRYGLSAIKGVGEFAMNSLQAERELNGNFKDLSDFLSRSNEKIVNKKQLESLISAGAFDCLHKNRRELFMNVQQMSNFYEISKNKKQTSLFSGNDELIQLKKCNEWNELELLSQEFSALGFYLSSHPMISIVDDLKVFNVKLFQDVVKEGTDGSVVLAGIIVKVVKKISKTGNRFVFIHLSDTSGAYEVVAFSEILTKYTDILIEGNIVIVKASVKFDGDIMRLTAWDLQPFVNQKLERAKEIAAINSLNISIKNRAKLLLCKTFLEKLPRGKVEISLIIDNKKMTLQQKYEINEEFVDFVEKINDY